MSDAPPLRILHVFRAPLGGLFRHVIDLVSGQIERGHQVGIVADSSTGGVRATETLGRLEPKLALGLSRFPIRRHIGASDFIAIRHVGRRVAETAPDILHGHGAKGAAFARLAAPLNSAIRAYTPHGGSLLFQPGTLSSRFYVFLETILRPRTDLFLFESAFSHNIYKAKVGEPGGVVRIVLNGVGKTEFAPITTVENAADVVFIGELRRSVKGVDVLIDAIDTLRAKGMALTAVIVGDGPDRVDLQRHVMRLELQEQIRFYGPLPAREAFGLGRLMVVPSRTESLPYIVLEAAAAGIPLISTNVGGIPEIFGPMAGRLIPAGDKDALADAIAYAVNNLPAMRETAAVLRERVASALSIEAMIDDVISAYRVALAARDGSILQ